MQIGVLGGTGELGRGLALRWAAAGHRIAVGSRARERSFDVATDLAARLESDAHSGGTPFEAATNLEACEFGEVVVLAVPARPDDGFFLPLIESLRGKVLLDCTVDLDPSDVTKVVADQPATALRIQRLLGPDVDVVAGFHTLAAAKLLDLSKPVASDTFIVGDVAAAKTVVTELAEAIGLRCFDAGGLEAGRTLERMTAMLISLNKRYRRRGLGFSLVGL